MLLMPFGFLNPYAAALAASNAPLLLDGLSCSVVGAFGMRHLRSAYLGPCVRVRRALDNDEQDIGFSNYLFDAPALLAFCGGGDGYVSKWYDQGAAGQHAAQAVASQQPLIVDAGAVVTLPNSLVRPALRWLQGAVTDLLNSNFAINADACACLSVAATTYNDSAGNRLAAFKAPYHGDTDGGGSVIFVLWGSDGSLYNLRGGTNIKLPQTLGTPFQATSVFGATTQSFVVDGVAGSPAAASGAFGTGTLSLGRGDSSPWPGCMAEHIVVAGSLSAADQATIRASQKSYYGTP